MSTWPKGWSWEVHLSKGQPDSKCDQISTWPKGWSWEVHLTKGQFWVSIGFLPPTLIILIQIPDFRILWKSDQMEPRYVLRMCSFECYDRVDPKPDGMGVCLTKGQPDSKCDQMSTRPKAWWWGYVWSKVSLTWRSDKMSTWSEACIYFGSFWLSEKRTSENLNILCILGLASQRSFLWNQRYVYMYVSCVSTCVCI